MFRFCSNPSNCPWRTAGFVATAKSWTSASELSLHQSDVTLAVRIMWPIVREPVVSRSLSGGHWRPPRVSDGLQKHRLNMQKHASTNIIAKSDFAWENSGRMKRHLAQSKKMICKAKRRSTSWGPNPAEVIEYIGQIVSG